MALPDSQTAFPSDNPQSSLSEQKIYPLTQEQMDEEEILNWDYILKRIEELKKEKAQKALR